MRIDKTPNGTIAKIASALHQVQGQLTAVSRSSEGYNYKFADLASCWDSVRQPMADAGLALIQTTYVTAEGENVLVTTLLHTSGEWISGELLVRPVKADPQSLGSSLSYARRYGMMGMLGISASDDDGAAASKPATKAAAREPNTKLREQYKALWSRCLKAGIDPRELETIAADSTDEEIMEAGMHNRTLLNAVENPEGS
jgi:hypothetical protein